MRNLLIVTFLLLIFSSCNGLKKWAIVNSEECGFYVEFPEKPVYSSRLTEVEFGKVNLRFYLLDAQATNDENYLYLAGQMELPDSIVSKYSIEAFFKSAIERSISSYKGKLLSVKEISYNKFPGREVKIDFKNGDSVITLRVYLVKNKEFLIETMAKPSLVGNDSQRRFFDSFKIKTQ